jgi:hypothetical protein
MSKNPVIERIACETLGIPTLRPRNFDRLDFHDLPVWALADALEEAFNAGLMAARTPAAAGD